MSLSKIGHATTNKILSKSGLLAKEKEEVAQERLKICKSNVCGEFTGTQCHICGCLMSLKVYAMDTSCPSPNKYWDKYISKIS